MEEVQHKKTEILAYINQNPVATLGTIDMDGTPHGAAVYVCADLRELVVYFLTKIKTQKYQNIEHNNRVSLTIVNSSENSSLQAKGRAEPINDAATIDFVMSQMAKLHADAVDWFPPIATLRAGAYTVVAIHLTQARLAHYQKAAIGDPHIFTEVG